MAKQITVEIAEDGTATVKYSGFTGELCHVEDKKLVQLLKSLGIDMKVESQIPTQEAFTAVKQTVKQTV